MLHSLKRKVTNGILSTMDIDFIRMVLHQNVPLRGYVSHTTGIDVVPVQQLVTLQGLIWSD